MSATLKECIVLVRRGEEGEGWRGEREGREGKERAILRDFLMTAAKASLQEKGRNQAMSKTERQIITLRVKPKLLTVAPSAYIPLILSLPVLPLLTQRP